MNLRSSLLIVSCAAVVALFALLVHLGVFGAAQRRSACVGYDAPWCYGGR